MHLMYENKRVRRCILLPCLTVWCALWPEKYGNQKCLTAGLYSYGYSYKNVVSSGLNIEYSSLTLLLPREKRKKYP